MYLNQRAAMREGLKYKDHDHEKVVKRMHTLNNLMIYLAENATKFTPEEMRRDIIPAMLKPRARVECVIMSGEDLVEKQDVVNLLRTISRGIKCGPFPGVSSVKLGSHSCMCGLFMKVVWCESTLEP